MMVKKVKRPGLGQQLADIRRRNGWTLAQVAEKTGLAVSTLSKVENDLVSLTYDNIAKLSDGLGVEVSEFFKSNANRSAGGRRAVTRAQDEQHLETPNYVYRYHSTDLRNANMVPILTELKTNTIESFGDLMSHPGEEFVFVVEGEVEVHTEFYAPVRLGKGESIYLDSTMAHGYLSVGDVPAKILAVCYAPSASIRERRADGANPE